MKYHKYSEYTMFYYHWYVSHLQFIMLNVAIIAKHTFQSFFYSEALFIIILPARSNCSKAMHILHNWSSKSPTAAKIQPWLLEHKADTHPDTQTKGNNIGKFHDNKLGYQ